ncbi:hypothetical protein GCM10020000_48180 [Streptomyces olivoverticillatus]
MHRSPAWDPGQYLRHSGHRTRPFHDLLARIPEPPGRGRPLRIADLGCGAGNVTALLAERWLGPPASPGSTTRPTCCARPAPTPGPRPVAA